MPRELPINAQLYFFDRESGAYTGQGNSGDSLNYVIPEGMTPIEPPIIEERKYARFDEDTQTWSLEWINLYDGFSQAEKDIFDAAQAKQEAVDAAQDKVSKRLSTDFNRLLKVLEQHLPLTAGQQAGFQEFHDDFDAWILAQEG